MSDAQQLRLVSDDVAADRSSPAHPARRPARLGRPLTDFGEVLTVEEAAAVLRISRASAYEAARIWRATRTEGLPVIAIGRRLLVPRAALEEMLGTTSRGTADPDPTMVGPDQAVTDASSLPGGDLDR
jgi:hypothetical protein